MPDADKALPAASVADKVNTPMVSIGTTFPLSSVLKNTPGAFDPMSSSGCTKFTDKSTVPDAGEFPEAVKKALADM